MHCHAHQGNPAKHQETNKQTKPETNNQKPHTPKSGDVTSTSLWVKRSEKAGGDNLVSSRNMHNEILCAMLTQAHRNKQQQRPTPKSQRVQEATKLNAETRDLPSQDPRDHKEQPSRHDIHSDTLKQTPTKPSRNFLHLFQPYQVG